MHEKMKGTDACGPHHGLFITRCFHFKALQDYSDGQDSDVLKAFLNGIGS